MKFILSLAVICSLQCYVSAMSDEMAELAAMLHNSCVAETGVEESLITDAQKGTFKDDPKLKCYMKCIFGQMAVIDDDGEIDVDTMIAVIPEDMKTDAMENAIKKCGTQKGSDNCDTAFLTNKCYYNELPEKYFLI